MNTEKRVIVIGAGLSGLAAAVALSARTIQVTVLEQKPAAGGRAYSFRDTVTGDVVDNGQHVLIAGYARTRDFLRLVGTEHLLNIQHRPSLIFHHPGRGFVDFHLPRLPSPLHLAAGVLSSSLLHGWDRVALLRAGLALRKQNKASLQSLTINQWLDSAGQSEESKRCFWEPLAIAIMNDHISRASAEVFVRSLNIAFLGGQDNAALVIPSVGLSELYVSGAEQFIRAHGGEVLYSQDVHGVAIESSRAEGVTLKDGSRMAASAVIVAVPWYRISSLLPVQLVQSSYSSLEQFESAPIVSIHLWFERDFMPEEFVGIIGRTVQWAFNKRKLNKESGSGGHVSLVISGAYEQVGMTNDELVAIALRDLCSVYPDCPGMALHSLVIREKRATLSITPEVEKLRPDQQTEIPNLFLAGDWTKTGLPSTIEGAIVSGERCAELAHRRITGYA